MMIMMRSKKYSELPQKCRIAEIFLMSDKLVIERPDMGKIGTGPHPHPEGFKKGGKVRGTGIAKKGFRPCKMR